MPKKDELSTYIFILSDILDSPFGKIYLKICNKINPKNNIKKSYVINLYKIAQNIIYEIKEIK